MADNSKAPAIKKGWMTKQGRGGMVKNWKKRFFVLLAGKLQYFVNEVKEYPYGEALKGELSLVNTECKNDGSRLSECQIFITSYNGENGLLVQTATPEEAVEWRAAINEHIKFANSSTEETVSRLSKKVTRDERASFAPEEPSPLVGERKSRPASVLVPGSPTSPTGAAGAAAATSAAGAAAPISKLTEPEKAPLEAFQGLLDGLMELAMDSESRGKFVPTVIPKIQSIISSITTNKGDFGNRNEDLLIPAVVLVLIVLFSLLPRLVLLINFLLRICGVLLMLSGAGLVGNGIWCLGENMSLLLVPTAKTTQIVTGGVYGIVRHPIYGGLILLCFGVTAWQLCLYKCFVTIALSIVLNMAAEIEEDALERMFPNDYPTYASHRKAFVPFLY